MAVKTEWISFKDEIPEVGRLILFGNHRMIEIALYHPEHPRIIKGMLAYKDITHYRYIDPPPEVPQESKWTKQLSLEEPSASLS